MKISRWWCTYGTELTKLAQFLSKLSCGQLFLYKVHCLVAEHPTTGSYIYENQYCVMKRTSYRSYDHYGKMFHTSDITEITKENALRFYDIADEVMTTCDVDDPRCDSGIKHFTQLDDPEVCMRLALLGKKISELPVFTVEYDDRDIFIGKNGEALIR